MTSAPDSTSLLAAVAAARAHALAGDLDKALEAARRAARAEPAATEAFAIWGVAAAELGDFVGAIEPLTLASDGAPAGSIGWANVTSQLARALSNVGFWSRAISLVEAVERWNPPDPLVRHRLGATFTRMNLMDRGLPHLEWAERAKPDWPDLLFDLALALMSAGRLDEAEARFERAIAQAPLMFRAHMALADVRTWSAGRNHVARLAEHRADPGLAFVDRARLGFALFKELDDLGRHDEAWPVLEEANEVSRADLPPWSAAEDGALIDALIERFPVTLFRSQAAPVAAGRVPIFVVGLPRSGTTLVERVLAAHSQVAALGELPTMPMLFRGMATYGDRLTLNAQTVRATRGGDWAVLAEAYAAETAVLGGNAPFAIDKMPINSMIIGAIRLAFPDARIVHLRRDPMDGLFSAYRIRFSNLYGWSYRLTDLADHYAHHHRLMAHWRDCLGETLIEVNYEDLVTQPETNIRALLAACGLDFEPACLTPHKTAGPVMTASITQVRSPITAAGVGAWRRYGVQLEELRSRLEGFGLLAE